MVAMPARNEPPLAARSRSGPKCARTWVRWLGVGAASLLAVACFLNPKTDDLPKFDSAPPFGQGNGIPGPQEEPAVPGGGVSDDGLEADPGQSSAPPTDAPEPSNTPDRDADAGAELSTDAGSDAG
jgi:hypothetical protein